MLWNRSLIIFNKISLTTNPRAQSPPTITHTTTTHHPHNHHSSPTQPPLITHTTTTHHPHNHHSSPTQPPPITHTTTIHYTSTVRHSSHNQTTPPPSYTHHTTRPPNNHHIPTTQPNHPTTTRDALLASLLDGVRASGNRDVHVKMKATYRGHRLGPFTVPVDEEVESHHLKMLQHPPSSMTPCEVESLCWW